MFTARNGESVLPRTTWRAQTGALHLAAFALVASACLHAAEPAAKASGPEPAAAATAPKPNSSAACLECHSDNELTMKKGDKKLSLFVDEKVVNASAHQSLECVDCHEKYDGEATPHRRPLVPVDCVGCHEDTGQKKHAFHPRLALAEIPAGEDTNCVACHGRHDVAVVKSPAFPFANGPQPQACGKCHEKARDHFNASAHGRAFAAKATNAPDCLTCHKDPVAPHTPAEFAEFIRKEQERWGDVVRRSGVKAE